MPHHAAGRREETLDPKLPNLATSPSVTGDQAPIPFPCALSISLSFFSISDSQLSLLVFCHRTHHRPPELRRGPLCLVAPPGTASTPSPIPLMPPLFFPLLPLAKLSLLWLVGAPAPHHGSRACSSFIGRPSHRIELLKLGMEPQPKDLAPPTPFSHRSSPDQRDLGTVGLLLFLVDRTQEQRIPPWLHPTPASAGGEELLHAILLAELRLRPMPRIRAGRARVKIASSR